MFLKRKRCFTTCVKIFFCLSYLVLLRSAIVNNNILHNTMSYLKSTQLVMRLSHGKVIWKPFDYTQCPSDFKEQLSMSVPSYYPEEGTGKTIHGDEMFPAFYMQNICNTPQPLLAILPVYSSINNFARRMAIRNTIGKECIMFNCKVAFICGKSMYKPLMQDLLNEYLTYKDIIIVDKNDIYRDLNDKAVGMLNWLLYNCQQPKYVIHFVDDAYVNVEMFYEDLERSGETILGAYVPDGVPVRLKSSKYYVNMEEYPYHTYPNFVSGVAYGFPNTLTLRLRCAVQHAVYNWLEDVWLMGHVRDVAQINVTPLQRPEHRFGKMFFKYAYAYIFIHSIEVHEFFEIYDSVQERRKVLQRRFLIQ